MLKASKKHQNVENSLNRRARPRKNNENRTFSTASFPHFQQFRMWKKHFKKTTEEK